MEKLNLQALENQELISILEYGTALKANNVFAKGIIEEIYYNKSGEDFFINASISKPAPVSCKIPGGARIMQNIFVSVYYNLEKNRVEKAVTLPDTTFTPVKGSNLLGILTSPNGDMMTYSIGENINNNSPIIFKKNADDGIETALLTFTWNPEDFRSEPDIEARGPETKLDQKADSVYSQTKRWFYLTVDRKGNPKGLLYDSTMNKFLRIKDLLLSDFETEFLTRAFEQAEIDRIKSNQARSYLMRQADADDRKFLI